MPIYEYECTACGERLEAIQKISDDPLTDCPHCHKPALKKLLSAPAFRLKGGGWYETDFKSGKKKNLAESEAKRDSAKENKKSDKADKKAKKSKTKDKPAASGK
jgi:putative FmdB family regulatory protein